MKIAGILDVGNIILTGGATPFSDNDIRTKLIANTFDSYESHILPAGGENWRIGVDRALLTTYRKQGAWLHFRALAGTGRQTITLALYYAGGGSTLITLRDNYLEYGNSYTTTLSDGYHDIDINLRHWDNKIDIYVDGVVKQRDKVWGAPRGLDGLLGFSIIRPLESYYIGEAYLAVDDTRGTRIATMVTDGVGTETGQLNGDASKLVGVNLTADELDTDTGGKQTFTFADLPDDVASVNRVVALQVSALASASATSPTKYTQDIVKIGGTVYSLGSPSAPGINKANSIVRAITENNPATGSPWTTADVQALEAGVEVLTPPEFIVELTQKSQDDGFDSSTGTGKGVKVKGDGDPDFTLTAFKRHQYAGSIMQGTSGTSNKWNNQDTITVSCIGTTSGTEYKGDMRWDGSRYKPVGSDAEFRAFLAANRNKGQVLIWVE